MKCGAVILAAGAATRFGSPKQLAEIDGEALLLRAIRVCGEAGFSPIVVVLGANVAEIQRKLDLSKLSLVINEAWHEGMGSSLRAGVKALANHDLKAAVVSTCDMPFVAVDHLQALRSLAEKTGCSVASRYEDHRGVPACFIRKDFAELLRSSGDSGGKSLLREAPVVELKDSSDIDTPDQLLAARNVFNAKS